MVKENLSLLTPEEEAAGRPSIEDTGEALARALAEKPFRDVAKGRTDAERAVLEGVADEQGDKAGQEYRELKELLPTEILGRLEKEFEEKLIGLKSVENRDLLEQFPEKFSRWVKDIKREKEAMERSRTFKDLQSLLLRVGGYNVVTPYRGTEGKKYYPSEEIENALYQTFGVGQTRSEVLETFGKLTEQQRKEIAKLIGDHQGYVSEDGYSFSLPTKIKGVYLYLKKYHSDEQKGPQILLKFTSEFVEREMK